MRWRNLFVGGELTTRIWGGGGDIQYLLRSSEERKGQFGSTGKEIRGGERKQGWKKREEISSIYL